MAPTPEETVAQEAPRKIERPLTGDEVVISGMSGIFPKSDSVFDFMKNLYDQVDMVSADDPRWVFNHPEVPKHLGQVNGMGKFDAQFFRVHYKQACTMEPMSRKLLEHAYGAIFDSGINPLQLRGRKVGIFIGSTFSESEKIVIYENVQRNGFGITGCNKAMYANRISYWIDGKGPSYAVDLACASSMACLEHAYRSISTGQCDAAIVGGCNLCMHPNVSLSMKRVGLTCLDGKTKCYDKNGDGYVRSDAISVIFLQKAKDAKRIYSEVYYAKGNYTLRKDDGFLPNRDPKDIADFLEAFYSEIDVSPEEVEYIEGAGAALAEADANELEVIGRVFAKEKPVKVGCVKSNMGNSEPASGVCALTKACLAYQKGEIPGNIHYYEPLNDVTAVSNGAVQVLQETSPFNRGFVALNSFSYTGANVHVLLKGHYKKKDPERYRTSIPYLVLVSGRQDSCVNKVLNILNSQPVDPEQIGLLHSIFESTIPGHMSRGYTIIENNEKNNTTTCLSQNVEYCPGLSRPIWFVYSGMGSQWATMGAELMRIPIFAAAIERCHKVLQPKGIDIVKILTEPDKTIYDNILNSFVGIAAVQIGLTDILTNLGIVPDNIIGHSVGELGCAYADGCFTAEEMILSAYSRGLVSVQTSFIKGSMAAVGLGYSTVLPLCPPEIEVACHNSNESSTISGPADVMKAFVSELTSRGVFAKEVPCSNIAYHSRYIADAGPGLLKYLSEVITDPQPRSKKWLSTSVPQEKWHEPVAQLSSAEYHTNNLLNPVLFEETSKLIPGNAIVIEIAPHGLLQAIIKRSLSECLHVPLTRRGHSDPVKFLLESVGKLYGAGLNPKVDSLYPKIEFPVSTETSLLSHFVEWEHSEDWPQAKYNSKDRVTGQVRDFVISIHDDDYKYFEGHVRNGNYVFPEAALLVLVWETFGMAKGINYKELSVIFQDVKFHGEAVIRKEDPLKLAVMINKGNDKFEVSYKNTCIASGYITKGTTKKITSRTLKCDTTTKDNDFILCTKDIYKMFHLKGFNYKNEFQSLHSTNVNRDEAIIKWTKEWVTFLDAIIQFNALSRNFDGVSSPHLIKKITIDINEHNLEVNSKENVTYCNAKLDSILGATRCGGVEFDGIVFNDKPKTIQEENMLQSRTFVPHFLTGNVDLETALYIHFQIVSDNVIGNIIKVIEFISQSDCDILSAIKNVSTKLISAEIDITSNQNEKLDTAVLGDNSKSDVFLVDNLLGDEKKMKNLSKLLTKNTFVLALEQDTTIIHSKYKLFNVISAISVGRQILILLNKADCDQSENVTYIPIIHDNTFSWVPKVQCELDKTRKVVLVAERQPICGILGLVKNLKEQYPNKLSCIIVNDYHAPSFCPDNNIFKEQIQKKLSINVLRKGMWGGYYYIPSEISTPIKNVTLSSLEFGDLDSLSWVEATTTQDNNNLVQVCYAGLNQKDIQKAMGKLESNKIAFGMDFSGIDSNGDKVMGLVSGGAMGSTVIADLDLTWPVPQHWTLEDAATVPLPYALAYYCLGIRGYFKKGMRILVSGGAGALGQAIISICLTNDCEVFTTVSDEQKKKFLLQLYPGLEEQNIGNSNDEYFKNTVLMNTNKEGCPLVINCLSGSMRESLMGCVASEGTFLDISEHDMHENKEFGMTYLIVSTYKGVQLSSIFRPENIEEKKMIQSMIAEGIDNGTVKPLSRIVYSPSEVSRAFRLLSTCRHRGRVLIRMGDPISLNESLEAVPKKTYSSTASYAVVCDDSEIGIELAYRLITNGARKLSVHIKPQCVDGYFKTKLASWRKLGVTVNLSTDNLNTEKACADFLKEGSKLGPLHGIFVVQDSNVDVKKEMIEQEEFVHKFKETSLISVNLDLISRKVCPELSHFVVVTRAAHGAVDDYVNTVAESICQSRNEIGLPALVFRIELLDELDVSPDDIQSKLLPQTLPAVLNALEASLRLNYNNVVSYNMKKPQVKDFNGKIARILGLKNIDNVNESLTLKDLIVSKFNIDEMKKAIKDTYQVSYPSDVVEQMTIERLKNLHKRFSEQHTNFDCGLGAFFTYIDKDECLATEPVIAMPTKLSNATENEEEIDPKETYIMLIPGFEGHHRIFQSVSERLKVQAMTLQLGPDVDKDSIREIAADLLKSPLLLVSVNMNELKSPPEGDVSLFLIGCSLIQLMQKRFELKSKFYFMGYSFGVNVALELAALMEKEGHVGIVYCLDSSPDALRAQLDAYLGNLTDAQLQDTIVEHMYRLMSGGDSTELKRDLERSTNWQQKVEACVNRLRGLVKYSHQYQRSILQTAYKRILLARNYEPDFKLESELVLMRGVVHPRSSMLSDDYNLYKYTKQPVQVFDLKTDHALAPNDCRVSNIINKLFDPVILEEFKNKNLCETYLADPFKIL